MLSVITFVKVKSDLTSTLWRLAQVLKMSVTQPKMQLQKETKLFFQTKKQNTHDSDQQTQVHDWSEVFIWKSFNG